MLAACGIVIGIIGCGMPEPPSATKTPGPTRPAATAAPTSLLLGGAVPCTNERGQYEISYPRDWFVHPAAPANNVEACSAFGPQPFDLTGPDGVTARDLPTITITATYGSCLGSDLMPVEVADTTVAGYPALRFTYPEGAISYVLNLRPEGGDVVIDPRETPGQMVGCDIARSFSIFGTPSHGVGEQEIRKIVDGMLATLRILDAEGG
jgi:hypothetical protein